MTRSGKDAVAEKLAAFETIVSEYEGPLLRYVARIVRQHDSAQNVVQEAFIKLFHGWEDEWQPSPRLSSWLYSVAHNCAVDHLRKESRLRLLHLRSAAETQDFVPPNRGEGFAISEDAEKAALALKALSLREQQLVVLKVYEGKSYAEIGEITGLSSTNVGYILHHAMKKLAAELKNQGKHE